MEDLDEGALLSVGEFKITVEQHRASLMNLFTLMMDYIELFVQHTRSEARTHQGVLKEILEAAQTGTTPLQLQALSRLLNRLHFSSLTPVDALYPDHAGGLSTREADPSICFSPVCIFWLPVGNDATLDAKITELRPYFREDFLTYLQSEYSRVTRPPMTDEAVTLANLLQVIQARLLAEVRAWTPHLERDRKCCNGLERLLVSKMLMAVCLLRDFISGFAPLPCTSGRRDDSQITVTFKVPSLTFSVSSLCRGQRWRAWWAMRRGWCPSCWPTRTIASSPRHSRGPSGQVHAHIELLFIRGV